METNLNQRIYEAICSHYFRVLNSLPASPFRNLEEEKKFKDELGNSQEKIFIKVDNFNCTIQENMIGIVKRNFETKLIPTKKRYYYFDNQIKPIAMKQEKKLSVQEQIEQLRKKIEELEQQSDTVKESVKKMDEGIKEVKKDIDLLVIDYSEKAVAIFGDTRLVKEQLKEIGARFNPYLNKDGGKCPGWILPKSKKELLQTILN
jgi:predicted ribosome quality control (RQC) complex YloA/Tae2 family protein